MRSAVLLLAAGAATDLQVLLLALVLLMGSAFFSGSETAVVSARRARLERQAESGRRDARAALHLLADTPRAIATTLVGTNLCNIGAASLATAVAVGLYGDRGPAIATLVLTPVVLFGAEIVPKALFRSRPTRLLCASSGALRLFSVLFHPAVVVSTAAVRVLLFLLRVPPAERRAVFGREDLEALFLFGRAGEEGDPRTDPEAAFRMAGKALDLSRQKVSEAMVPLIPERTCRAGGTVGQAVERFRVSRGKLLAALDSRGTVVGFVAAKEILGQPLDWPVAPYVRPALILSPEDSLYAAMAGFRRQRRSVALVRGAGAESRSILTPEDVLEEIVGELRPGGRPPKR